MPQTKLKLLDLFSGLGGFSLGLESTGFFETIAFVEKDEFCQKVLKKNFNNIPIEGDIRNVKGDRYKADVITGGFPCQPFSKAGQQLGFKDKSGRGNLFFHICNIVQHHKPKYMILENVKNLKSHDNGNTWQTIKHNINQLGYHTYNEPVVLNTLYFNVPQSRERVIILCKRKDIGELPDPIDITTLKKAPHTCSLRSIIDDSDLSYNAKYDIKGKTLITHEVWNNFTKIFQVFSF